MINFKKAVSMVIVFSLVLCSCGQHNRHNPANRDNKDVKQSLDHEDKSDKPAEEKHNLCYEVNGLVSCKDKLSKGTVVKAEDIKAKIGDNVYECVCLTEECNSCKKESCEKLIGDFTMNNGATLLRPVKDEKHKLYYEVKGKIVGKVELSEGNVVKAENIKAKIGSKCPETGCEFDACACTDKECKSINEGSCKKFTGSFTMGNGATLLRLAKEEEHHLCYEVNGLVSCKDKLSKKGDVIDTRPKKNILDILFGKSPETECKFEYACDCLDEKCSNIIGENCIEIDGSSDIIMGNSAKLLRPAKDNEERNKSIIKLKKEMVKSCNGVEFDSKGNPYIKDSQEQNQKCATAINKVASFSHGKDKYEYGTVKKLKEKAHKEFETCKKDVELKDPDDGTFEKQCGNQMKDYNELVTNFNIITEYLEKKMGKKDADAFINIMEKREKALATDSAPKDTGDTKNWFWRAWDATVDFPSVAFNYFFVAKNTTTPASTPASAPPTNTPPPAANTTTPAQSNTPPSAPPGDTKDWSGVVWNTTKYWSGVVWNTTKYWSGVVWNTTKYCSGVALNATVNFFVAGWNYLFGKKDKPPPPPA